LQFRFSKTGAARIGRVAENTPDRRSFPAPIAAAGRNLSLIELTGDGANAHSRARVQVEDCTHDFGFCFYHLVVCRRGVCLLDVTVAVRATGKHIDRSLLGAMPFATPGALRNLGSFIFSQHALELHQQLIFGRGCGGSLQENQFNSTACQFLSQQDLIGVLTAQSIGTVDEHGGDLACRGQVPHCFQSRPQQGSAAIAFVLKLPRWGNGVSVGLRVFDQRRSLALDSVIFFLLIRRDARVNGCRFVHASSPGRCV
jgi:hypothetical protein